MAALFVPVWDQALKVCQFAERPIQKKISCVSIPKIITHSILPPDTHTTNLAAIQRNKSVPACVHVNTLAIVGGRAGNISYPGQAAHQIQMQV